MTPKLTPKPLNQKGKNMAITISDYAKTKHTGLKLHKKGIEFLFDITVDGKRYRKKWESNPGHTKADRLKTAYMAMEEFRSDTVHQNTIVVDMGSTVLEYWNKLLETKDWKPYMVKEYTHYYNKNLTKLSSIKIKDLKSAHFTSLNATLKHLSIRSRRKAYEILQPLIELAIEDEIIDASPIKKRQIPIRDSKKEKKIVTDAVTKYKNVHAAIHSIYGSDDIIVINKDLTIECSNNPMYRAIFLFGFYGRRIGETLQLQWKDIKFDKNEYTVRGSTAKSDVDMTFDLPSDVKDALLEFRNYTGNIFTVKTVGKEYYKIRAITEIEEFTFHWMRNLAVSALSAEGVKTTHLSAMLGHTDAGTLTKYLSLQEKESTKATNKASKKLLGR